MRNACKVQNAGQPGDHDVDALVAGAWAKTTTEATRLHRLAVSKQYTISAPGLSTFLRALLYLLPLLPGFGALGAALGLQGG
jgi:hypothetical protein